MNPLLVVFFGALIQWPSAVLFWKFKSMLNISELRPKAASVANLLLETAVVSRRSGVDPSRAVSTPRCVHPALCRHRSVSTPRSVTEERRSGEVADALQRPDADSSWRGCDECGRKTVGRCHMCLASTCRSFASVLSSSFSALRASACRPSLQAYSMVMLKADTRLSPKVPLDDLRLWASRSIAV